MLGAYLADMSKQQARWTPHAASLDASSAWDAPAMTHSLSQHQAGPQLPARHGSGSLADRSSMGGRCVTQPLQPTRQRQSAVGTAAEGHGKRSAGGSRIRQPDRENCSSLSNAHNMPSMASPFVPLTTQYSVQ